MAAGDKIKNQELATHFNWIDGIDFTEAMNAPPTGGILTKNELTPYSILM